MAVEVANGAFTCTPEDVVAQINDVVSQDEDGVLLPIGEYTESGKAISAKGSLAALSLTMEEDSERNLIEARLFWTTKTNDYNVIVSAGAYCSALLNMLSPSNAEAVYNGVYEIYSTGTGSADFSVDSVYTEFMAMDGNNYLTISAQPIG